MSEIRLIVGLGNPGKEYEKTRHNLGFRTVDLLAQDWSSKWKHWKSQADILTSQDNKTILLKPSRFMNNSGIVVRDFIKFRNIKFNEFLVISDDFTIPLGKMRLRRYGSAGGHNGLQSIIENIQTSDFARLRLGMGPVVPGLDPREFVLSEFNNSEKEAVNLMINKALDIIKVVLNDGIEKAASKI